MINKQKSIFKYVGLLVSLVLCGIAGLFVAQLTFDRMTERLIRDLDNGHCRQLIGYEVHDAILHLEADYFQIAPMSGLYGQTVIIERLNERIDTINHYLDVLENGGSFESEMSLNRGLTDRVTKHFTYRVEEPELYNLTAIELRPKLEAVRAQIDGLEELVSERMRSRKNGDRAAFFDVIAQMKSHLVQSIPLFHRMLESANGLLYSSLQQMDAAEAEAAMLRRRYMLLERALVLFIFVSVFALSAVAFLKIRSVVKKERAAVDELHRAEKFLRTVLDSVTSPLYVVDAATHEVCMANAAAKAHIKRAGAVHCYECIFDENSPCCGKDEWCPLETVIQTAEALMMEQVLVIDGEKRIIEVHGYPVLDDQGAVVQMVEYRVDITERKLLQNERRALDEKLARLRRMDALGVMAGGVAHDLNNILSGVTVYPDLILETLPHDSSLKPQVEAIRESGRRAVAVVADLLTITRGVASEKAVSNLNRIVGDYLESPQMKRLRNLRSEVTVRTDLDPGLMNMVCAPIQIQKTLMNLVLNAAEAIPGQGEVRIATENCRLDKSLPGADGIGPGNYVRLTVSDTGVGIKDEDVGHIFDPFYTKRMMGRAGTGLGLVVVWNAIEDHKGHVSVQSGSFGTVFELLFPATEDALPEAIESVSLDELRGGGQHILVVDDDDMQRMTARDSLKVLGYNVHVTRSGEEGVSYLQEQTVDLVVLDMIMDPGMDGLETYQKMVALRPGLKCIIVSGYSESRRVQAAQELGAGGFLRKPYSIMELGATLRAELAEVDA